MSFYKIKLLVEIDKKLKDSLEVTHPTLGDFEIFLVYENLNRVCLFSGKVGHEQTNCGDKTRMARLRLDPRYRDRSNMKVSTQNKIGPWINNLALLPVHPLLQPGPSHQHPNTTTNPTPHDQATAQNLNNPPQRPPRTRLPTRARTTHTELDLNPNPQQET